MHCCATAKAHEDRLAAAPPPSPGAAACRLLSPRLGLRLRRGDKNGLGCGDAVRPSITLERRVGGQVRVGLDTIWPAPCESRHFGVILSTNCLDEEGGCLCWPQPLPAQQMKMPFAGAQGTPVYQSFLQGSAHLLRQFLISSVRVTFELAVGLGRHAVVHARFLPNEGPQANRSAIRLVLDTYAGA